MRAIDKIKEVATCLRGVVVDDAEKEAEALTRHSLGMSTARVYSENPQLTAGQMHIVDSVLFRRLNREPLQYILGFEQFLDLKILVYPGVLIPRPETELMAEQAIKAVNDRQLTGNSRNQNSSLVTRHSLLSILDLCTGSGCLALALAKEFPDCVIYGTDISGLAIECAKKNAEINEIKNITFLQGDLFKPFEKLLTFDLIISNPPYIKTDDIKTLQPEVKDWEPVSALDGGLDGLDFYRKICGEAGKYLKKNGRIMLEVGVGQSDSVKSMAKNSGFRDITLIKDYSGVERILLAEI